MPTATDSSARLAPVRTQANPTPPPNPTASPAGAMAKTGTALAGKHAPPLPQNWRVLGFRDAVTASTQPPPWVVEDLLLAQSATLISAQPHSMKSLALLQACLESVACRVVWGHFKAANVKSTLFLEIEDPAIVVADRIRHLARGLGLSDASELPGFHYMCVPPFRLEKHEKHLERLVQDYRLDFIGVSTLQAAVGDTDMQSQPDMAPTMAMIVRLSRLCPVFLLTHAPWDTKARRAYGTVMQTANFLTTMNFQKKKSKTDQPKTWVNVLLDSKVGVSEDSFNLELVTEPGEDGRTQARRLSYTDSEIPQGRGKNRVLELFGENPDASNAEIADQAGVSERYVRGLRKRK